jgi:hypothetical protein
MPDDRSNDAFDFAVFRNGLWQWPVADDTDLWAPLISGTQEWCSRCTSTIYALNKHWFEFLQKRVQEDFALPQHIMSCRTPVDIWSVYMQFVQKAVTDYQKVFAELGKLGIVVGSEPVMQKPKKNASRVDEFRRSALQ